MVTWLFYDFKFRHVSKLHMYNKANCDVNLACGLCTVDSVLCVSPTKAIEMNNRNVFHHQVMTHAQVGPAGMEPRVLTLLLQKKDSPVAALKDSTGISARIT